ncbi:hypothetical protein pipiens_013496 [Culex pipiens pipiens]|uniref:C2H2-type domain-containing protein n=1 Tax=Culex pipiens pipiens TaxID=38569 RepID=A0ABD1CY65_CULPP
MAPCTNVYIENLQSSPIFALPEQSKPEPFCSFCLRERPQNVEFYKHVIGASEEMRNSLQSMLGYDFNLANFAICKPCWKVIQLVQDFRLRCLKANEVVQRMTKGLSNVVDDGWFSAKNLAMIESVRMSVQDQMRHIERINHECAQCHKTFKTERGLINHGPFCVHRFETPPADYFKNHLEKHGTIATFQCTQNCDKLFFSEPRRAHHERICAENARNLACRTCGKRFKTRYQLRTHEWCQHSENARIFPCKVCGKMFKQQYAVNSHMKSHAVSFDCEVCPLKFLAKRFLTHHLKTMHADKVAAKRES